MVFDKKAYWDRRERKLRGQGNRTRTSIVTPTMVPTTEGYKTKEKKLSKYAIRKNTKRARKAQVNGI